MYLLMLGKEEERERTPMWERNIDWLSPVHSPIGHQIVVDKYNILTSFVTLKSDSPTNWTTRPGLLIVSLH